MPLPVGLLLKGGCVVAHDQGDVKVVVVVKTLKILIRAGAKSSSRQEKVTEEDVVTVTGLCGDSVFLPVPQSDKCILMQFRGPFLVVSGNGCLGHTKGLHAIGASMVSDVVVQLVSCYHPGGNGEAP